MSDLYRAFLELPGTAAINKFTAVLVASSRRDFLAKTPEGSPVFLLHDTGPVRYIVTRKFRYLSTEFHATCQVQTGDEAIEGQFALVACDPAAPELYELFIRCVGAAVENLSAHRATDELVAWADALTELFRVLSEPSTREVSGFWSELWVIANCGNPARALEMWHDDVFETFDFSTALTRVEVKSTTLSSRSHHFALQQLTVPAGGVGFVVSLMLQPLAGGVGILDLARRIEDLLVATALKAKLWKGVTEALGKDFSESLDRRFDPAFAQTHAVIYEMSDVPKMEEPSDPRITGVRFTVDLSSVQSSLAGTFTANLQTLFRNPS